MLASKELTMQRLNICSGCDRKVVTFSFIKCAGCNCLLTIKARAASSTCPLDKWETLIKQEK